MQATFEIILLVLLVIWVTELNPEQEIFETLEILIETVR